MAHVLEGLDMDSLDILGSYLKHDGADEEMLKQGLTEDDLVPLDEEGGWLAAGLGGIGDMGFLGMDVGMDRGGAERKESFDSVDFSKFLRHIPEVGSIQFSLQGVETNKANIRNRAPGERRPYRKRKSEDMSAVPKKKKIDESHNYYNSAPPVKRDRTDLGYFENSPIKKGVVKVKQTSSFRGVSCCGKDRKFQARIRLNNSVKYLGRYATEVEAALVYDDAARALKGSKAPTNFKKMDAETVEHLKQAFVESGGVIPEQFQHLINRGRTKTHTTQSTTAEGKVYPEELSKFTQLALQTGPESPLPKVHGKQAPDISPQDRKSSSFKSSQVFPHPSRLETSNFNKLNRVNI